MYQAVIVDVFGWWRGRDLWLIHRHGGWCRKCRGRSEDRLWCWIRLYRPV